MADAAQPWDATDPLARLILRRLALSAFSLLAVSIIIFGAVELLPGDAAQRALGREATVESLAVLRSEMRLDDPAIVRYGRWLGGILQGDLGRSLVAKRPVAEYLGGPLRYTLLLGGLTLAVHIPLSIGLGLVSAAAKRDGPLDMGLSAVVLLALSVPEFVTGIFLIVLFSVELGWFPPLSLIDQARTPAEVFQILFLPILTLNAAMTAYVVRQTRDSMIEVLRSDYVRMARLRGFTPAHIVLFHALPSALGPAINAIALNAAWLIGGIVVVEVVFNYPGLGRLLVEAISFHDVPIIQAVALTLSAAHIAVNLGADICTILLNPKLRTQAA